MQQRVALISDIHGNIDALSVVLADIAHEKVERILCLGDVIGYGPEPVACLKKARDFELVLLGNHEEALIHGPFGMSPIAKTAIEWTRDQVEQADQREGLKLLRFVEDLPLTYVEDDMMLVHGSPRDPTVEYVLQTDCDDIFGEVPEKIASIFAAIPRLCFIGHSHVPGIITEDARFLAPSEFGMRYRVGQDRFICNVGSVGQPRDGDPRACYVIFDGEVIEYRRLRYDVATAMAKIRASGTLHERLAARLETGS